MPHQNIPQKNVRNFRATKYIVNPAITFFETILITYLNSLKYLETLINFILKKKQQVKIY